MIKFTGVAILIGLSLCVSAYAKAPSGHFAYVYGGYYYVGDKNCEYTEKDEQVPDRIKCFDGKERFTRYSYKVPAESVRGYNADKAQADAAAKATAQQTYNNIMQGLQGLSQTGRNMANTGQQMQGYQAPQTQSYQQPDGTWVYCRRATDMMVSCTSN